MADVPSVDEYRKRFAKDISEEIMIEQRRQYAIEQERQRREAACNKHILDTIAKDTRTFSIVSWRFDKTNCNAAPSIAILRQKGYTVENDIEWDDDDWDYETGTFTVTLNKY